MRLSVFLLLMGLLVTLSCNLAPSSNSDASNTDFPVPFPNLHSTELPPPLQVNENGRPDFYYQTRTIGNQAGSTRYLHLEAQGRSQYLTGPEPSAKSSYFEKGVEVGPYPDYFDDPRARLSWSNTGVSGVCEMVKLNKWHCEGLETEQQYLGLKFVRDGDIYYGWMRVGTNSEEEGAILLIHDLAVAQEAGEPIRMGEHP